jgi:GYF domain 2
MRQQILPRRSLPVGNGMATSLHAIAARLACIVYVGCAFAGTAAAQSIPPPPPDAISYFVSIAGTVNGPFSIEAIKARMTAGDIKPDAYVLKKGSDTWLKATQVEAFNTAVPAMPLAPANPSPSPVADLRSYLIGDWISNPVQENDLSIVIEVSFNADGNSVARSILSKAGQNQQSNSDAGPWTVSGTEDAFEIKVNSAQPATFNCRRIDANSFTFSVPTSNGAAVTMTMTRKT